MKQKAFQHGAQGGSIRIVFEISLAVQEVDFVGVHARTLAQQGLYKEAAARAGHVARA
jgi:hypothetical protein